MTKLSDEKLLQEAKERFRKAQEWESTARANYMADVRFGTADSYNLFQWAEQVSQSRMRVDKPCLTINRVRQYCNQIVNDGRNHKPQVEIRPVGNGSSYKSAEIFEGVVRHIELNSNAQQAYDNGMWHAVYGGWGYWRVTTDYAHDDSFDQEVYIKRIADPLSVYLDPFITEYDGSDAKYAFVFRDMDRKDFEEEYPRYKDAASLAPLGELMHDDFGWHTKDRVRIAEYYRRTEEDDTLHFLDNGQTVRESDVHPELRDQLKINSTSSRGISTPKVEWFLIAGDKIVEKRDWLGRYIPIVRVVGEEIVINKILDRKSHVRGLIDPQRSYNWFASSGIEHVALQTKTPFVAPVAAIEGYEAEWAQANQQNLAILPYNHMDDADRPIPPPQREAPPQYAPAYVEGMKVAQNDMMMASGQYEAVMGQESNERSGKALQERQRAGLTSTYHFIDHLSTAIRFTGKILIDLIPKVYDTERIIKIMGVDGTESTVKVDPSAPQAHQEVPALDPESLDEQHIAAIFNPCVGQYDVEADIGPAYSTRRQEAFDALSNILAQNESLAPIVGDLMFRSADFPLADEIAERMKNMVPDKALGKGPSQEVVQLQQQLAMQHQAMSQMQQELQQSKTADGIKDLQKEIEWYKAETDRIKAVAAADPAAMMPIIRQLVSEVLGVPVNQVIAHHVAENAAMIAPQQPPGTPMPPQQPPESSPQGPAQ